MICQILPGIFQYRALQDEYKSWLQSRFLSAAGGVHLPTTRTQETCHDTNQINIESNIQPLAWWDSALLPRYQDEITHILIHKRLDLIRWSDSYTLSATCASRTADIRDGGYKRYPLWLTTYGMAFCMCPAFSQGKGACKHLWALRLEIPKLITSGHLTRGENIVFPISYGEALNIYQVFIPSMLYQGATDTNQSGPQALDVSAESSRPYMSTFPKSLDPIRTIATHTNTWLLAVEDLGGGEEVQTSESQQSETENGEVPNSSTTEVCHYSVNLSYIYNYYSRLPLLQRYQFRRKQCLYNFRRELCMIPNIYYQDFTV